MGTIKHYKVKAEINGGVKITPNPLSMRFNDMETPKLEVEVVYTSSEGKQRNFNLTDIKILFETVTPGGATVIVSNNSSECFELINPVNGRFDFLMPEECKDALGNSKIAYFRFMHGDTLIHSTGDFIYTVIKDVYSYPANYPKVLENFNADLRRLEKEFEAVKIQVKDSAQKAGEYGNRLKKVNNHQDKGQLGEY